ncbi:MAG: hypothetical protein ACFWUE_07190 [Xylanivirga thermophila]|jgi:hypothetical protein|uniref:hypothetical protein n=1 Tax=Xylanivirga thermophila TaxID=2496273 RepID=UPI0039F5897F
MTKKQAINILNQINKTAHDGSLTGALSGGVHIFVNAYNSIRQTAIEEKWISDDEIIPILDVDGDDNMDTVGCASVLLVELLTEE